MSSLPCCSDCMYTREKKDLERKFRENIDISVKVVRPVQSWPASTVYYVLRSVAVQNILCWLACFVHNGPPSPKFQILPSQLRQRADRAAGLCIKSLGCTLMSWVNKPFLPGNCVALVCLPQCSTCSKLCPVCFKMKNCFYCNKKLTANRFCLIVLYHS